MIERFRRLRLQRGDAGFTLIELLVVIVILGILSAVVIFSVRGVTDKGSSAAQATDAQTLRTAEEAFCAKNGFFAPDVATLTSAGLVGSGSGSINAIVATNGPCGDGSKGPSGFQIECLVAQNSCTNAVANGTPAAGGTMVLAASNLNGPYNPATTSSGNSHPLAEAVFNGLLAFDTSGNIVPDLATAVPTVANGGIVNNGDGTQDVKVTLRPGMVWQDSGVVTPRNPTGGPEPITNADVFFSYTQGLLRSGRTAGSMDPALGFDSTPATFTNPSGGAINLFNDASNRPLGVDFHFLYPYSPLIRQMNVTEAPIMPQHVYAHCAQASAGGDATYHDTLLTQTAAGCPESFAPVGSGPFKWGGLSNGNTVLTLTKNTQYFKPGLPLLSKVVLQLTSTAATATALAASRSTANSVDTAGISASALTSPFNFTTSSSYNVVSVPRGSGGGNCINTVSFNLWQPTGPLPEFGASDPGITGGLPGTSPPETQGTIGAKAANAPYDNPILSSLLVRKALFEGFNRAQAAISDTGVATAVNAPAGTARMADSIYDSNLAGVYAPTTFPGGTGASLGQPTVSQANTDLDAAGWDGPRVNDSNNVSVRTWSGNVASPFGLAVGTQLKLDISHFTSGSAPTPVIASQFVSDMKTIGVDVIDRNGLASWPGTEAARNFEIGIVSYCNGDDPVVGVQRQYVSSSIPNSFAANTTGYRDQQVTPLDNSMDGLWAQANRATTAAGRTAIYGQIQSLAVSTLTQIQVDESVSNRVTRSVCQGLNNQNTGLFVETAYCSA